MSEVEEQTKIWKGQRFRHCLGNYDPNNKECLGCTSETQDMCLEYQNIDRTCKTCNYFNNEAFYCRLHETGMAAWDTCDGHITYDEAVEQYEQKRAEATKITILGSCRFSPYMILAKPDPLNPKYNKEEHHKFNTDEEYDNAVKLFYPAIDESDVIFVYAPDGVGEHTQRDIDYAVKQGKPVIYFPQDKEKAEKYDLIEAEKIEEVEKFLTALENLT